MHRTSLRSLGEGFYSPALIEKFLSEIGTLDDTLLADGTCLLMEVDGAIVASGAWTLRLSNLAVHDVHPLQPYASGRHATIRAVFTDPRFVRRGLASTIIRLCELEATGLGRATKFDLYATLAGVPLYRRLGYRTVSPVTILLSDGERFEANFMSKPADGSTSGPLQARQCLGLGPTPLSRRFEGGCGTTRSRSGAFTQRQS